VSAGSVRRAATPRRVFSQLLERGTVDVDNPARCVGCGCTDSQGCPEGCYWLAVNRRTGEGVCSCCPDLESAGARRQ
jgi:hypothetical protein